MEQSITFNLPYDLPQSDWDKVISVYESMNGWLGNSEEAFWYGIDHFFVHGEYQSRGVGHLLMEKILHEGMGKERLYSYVSYTAKLFYLRHGFVVEKVRQEEIRGCKIENNLMVRTKTF